MLNRLGLIVFLVVFSSGVFGEDERPPRSEISTNNSTYPSLSIRPTGNNAPALATVTLQGTSNPEDNVRNFQVNFGLVSNSGNRCRGPQCGNVTLYTGVDCQTGTTDCWAQNTLLRLGADSGSRYTAQTVEIDQDNFQGDRGSGSGISTFSAPNSYGLTLSGAGSYLSTAAISITSGLSKPIWNHGIVIPKDAVSQSALYDNSRSAAVVKATNLHKYGLDFSQASFSDAAIVLHSDDRIAWRVGQNMLPALSVNGHSELNLGDGRISTIIAKSTIVPDINREIQLGIKERAWSKVFGLTVVTGRLISPIVESDSDLAFSANAGTVSFRTAKGVQAQISASNEQSESYVELRGGTSQGSHSAPAITSNSSTHQDVALVVAGKGTEGVLTGAFIRSSDPDAGDIPNGMCTDWYNTTAKTYKHVCNFGGILRSLDLN